MINFWQLTLAAITGIGLGVFFYGGLYYTVTHGLRSSRPALWFFCSFLLRMSVVLTAFYFVSDGHWQRIIATLTGFVVTRIVFQVWQKSAPPTDQVPVKILSEANGKVTMQVKQNAS